MAQGAGVEQGVDQGDRLVGRARAQLDQRGGPAAGRDLGAVGGQDLPLGPGRVVLGQGRDLLEEGTALLVVEPPRRQSLGAWASGPARTSAAKAAAASAPVRWTVTGGAGIEGMAASVNLPTPVGYARKCKFWRRRAGPFTRSSTSSSRSRSNRTSAVPPGPRAPALGGGHQLLVDHGPVIRPLDVRNTPTGSARSGPAPAGTGRRPGWGPPGARRGPPGGPRPRRPPRPPGPTVSITTPHSPSGPKRMGSPWASGITSWAGLLGGDQVEGPVVEHVAVLVHLDERRPLCSYARRMVSIMCLRSMSWVRATKVASAPRASDTGL